MDEILKQKQIEKLYHFTRTENLKNIFRYGIMPRESLDMRGIDCCYNDTYRYDDCCNAVCASIEFPNYKMFYKLRTENPETDWVVLELDARILCEFECAFCWTNAGDASMYSVSLKKRIGVQAFLELFDDREGYPKRQELNIFDWYPTNPQAEVLIFGTIPINYIQGVYFEDADRKRRNLEVIPDNISAIADDRLFKPRSDWKAWKN